MSTRATWDTIFGIGIALQHSGHIGSYQATTDDQNTTSQSIDNWVGSSLGARVSSVDRTCPDGSYKFKFSGEFLSNLSVYDFTSEFRQVVDSYKRLQVLPGIRAEVETTIAIEAEEIHAPGIDYSSVKEFLICQPLPKITVQRKKIVKNKKPTLMVDFSFVRELIPPALPKVNTTYIYREKVAVVNEWHFMLLQLRGLSYGILFYVPGTELWSFVDISVSSNHHQPALTGDSVELPLDLIAWQIFDFFTRRVSNHTLDIKEGFAPFSLSCPDKTLAKLLSSLFLDLGLPSQRQVGISKENQVPIKYREQITTLAATLVSVDSMLTCAGCFGLFAHMNNSLSLCSVCSETSEYYRRNSNSLPNREYLQVGEVEGRRNSKGSNTIVCELPRFSIGYLPQSFHFARKRDAGLVEKRGKGSRLSKGELRKAKKSRTKKSTLSGPSRPTGNRSQDQSFIH